VVRVSRTSTKTPWTDEGKIHVGEDTNHGEAKPVRDGFEFLKTAVPKSFETVHDLRRCIEEKQRKDAEGK